jgi:GDP-4-dehydro-6-deoxy-D-mannose reductase
VSASVTLVTGAAGFAGSHLLDLLTASGGTAVAWHRPGGKPARPTAGVDWEAVDLLDLEAVSAAIARLRPSVVYHCAGAAHVGRSWDATASTLAINVRGTHHLLQALERAGTETRVLVPSSAMVYAPADQALAEDHPLRPASPYGLSKLAQEMLAARTDGALRVMIPRPFNHFGPRQDPFFAASGFARRIADIEQGRAAPELTVGNLDARRDLTDVRDTVRAYTHIVERGEPGRPYNVCRGAAISIRDLLDMLRARAHVPIAVAVDPNRLRPNDVPLVVGNPSRTRDEIGWAASIPIEQTVDDLLDYWRRRQAAN